MNKNALRQIVAIAILATALPAIRQNDAPKCKDHPLFTRVPDYWIRGCVQKQFDAYNFTVAKGKKEPVEGNIQLAQDRVELVMQ